MRKITIGPVATFLSLSGLAFIVAYVPVEAAARLLFIGTGRGFGWFVAWFAVFYVVSIAIYRAYFRIFPLKAGDIPDGSASEFHYHVYTLFYLILFQPLTRSLFIPVPLMRLIYLGLGAKLGTNTYSGGTILDPPLTTIGANTIVGHDALVFSHVIEGERLAWAPVEIGDNVTVGAKAVVMPGVFIGDGAIIGVGAVLTKYTRVGPNEVWLGNPARCRRRSKDD